MSQAEAKKFDPFAWWKEKREKYREAWDKHGDEAHALKVAKDEYEYRSGELDKIVSRATQFAAIATALMAAQVVVLQLGGSTAVIVIAKVGMAITSVGPITLLLSYLPRWRSLKDRRVGKAKFISPLVWTQLITSPFDEFAQCNMRTERKTGPLDRYKDLLTIVIVALIVGFFLLVLAFMLR